MRRATLVATAALSVVAVVGITAPTAATQGDHKQAVCHPVNGAGETGYGWNLIRPDQASSHIDEATGAGKHHAADGRTDVYAVDGICPGAPATPDPTPTATPTSTPTADPSEPSEPSVDPSTSTTPTPKPEPEPEPTVTSTNQPPRTPTQAVPIPRDSLPPAAWETRTRYRQTCATTTVITQRRLDGGPWQAVYRDTTRHESTCVSGHPVMREEGF